MENIVEEKTVDRYLIAKYYSRKRRYLVLLKIIRKLVPNINDHDKYISFPDFYIFHTSDNTEYYNLDFNVLKQLEYGNIVYMEIIKKWKL
jgi:hypothetical protein